MNHIPNRNQNVSRFTSNSVFSHFICCFQFFYNTLNLFYNTLPILGIFSKVPFKLNFYNEKLAAHKTSYFQRKKIVISFLTRLEKQNKQKLHIKIKDSKIDTYQIVFIIAGSSLVVP